MITLPIKLQDMEIFRYELPLRRPLLLTGVRLWKRCGVLIRMRAGRGISGWGEVAPLPGLHREDLAQVIAALQIMRRTVAGRIIPPDPAGRHEALSRWADMQEIPPSLQFGMETAMLNLLAHAAGTPLAMLLCPTARSHISLNGLATGSGEALAAELRRLAQENYAAVKLKVGRCSLAEDIARVHRARELLPPAVSLRLDANRAWSLPRALEFVEKITPHRIEYLEEPLQNPAELPRLVEASGIPLALDETLAELPPEAPWPLPTPAAVILKPGVLGGLERAQEVARRAARGGTKAVVSSAFESGVGLAALANLAAALNPVDVPAGLDTFRWLKGDVLRRPFAAPQGQIHIAALHLSARQVNLRRLKRIGK